MNKQLQYFVTSRFLAYLEADGYPFGVDAHLQVRDLIEKLPAQTSDEHLKNYLTALLARNKDEQTEFYLIFSRISKEYAEYIDSENKNIEVIEPLNIEEKHEEGFFSATFWTNIERFKKISAWLKWRVLLVLGLFLMAVVGILVKIASTETLNPLPPKNTQQPDTLFITLGLNSSFDTIRYDTIYKTLQSLSFVTPEDTPQYIRHEILDSQNYRYIGKDIGSFDTVMLRVLCQGMEVDTICLIFSVKKRIETEQETLNKLLKTVQIERGYQGSNLKLLTVAKSQEHELAYQNLIPSQSITFSWQNRYMGVFKWLMVLGLSCLVFAYFYFKQAFKLKKVAEKHEQQQTNNNNNNIEQTQQKNNLMNQNNNDVSYILERQTGTRPPYIWNLQLETPSLATNLQLSATNVLMRRRSESEARHFNIGATVNRTIRQAGRTELVYAQRTEPNEYLLLIDMPDINSHRSRLFDAMFKIWQRAEILVERFFFNGDLRLCWNEQHRRGLSLPELAQKYPQHRLLIFSNAFQLLAPEATHLAKWTNIFDTWQRKIIFTMRPCEDWDAREEALCQKFAVAPANIQGIATAIETMDILQSQWSVPFDLARFRKVNCLDIEPITLPQTVLADPESKRNQERLHLVLKSKLVEYNERGETDERLLWWLAVTAIYPTLEWDWTLQLGSIVEKWAHTEGRHFDTPLVSFENLYSLIRLSYFQEGKMPDNLRIMLLHWLSSSYPELLEKVRAELQRIMEQNPPPRESVAFSEFSMTLVLNEALLNPELRRPDIQTLINGLAETQVLNDFVTLKQLNRKKDELDIEIPAVWKNMLAAQPPVGSKNAAEAEKKLNFAQNYLKQGNVIASLPYLSTAADLLDDENNTLKIKELQNEINDFTKKQTQISSAKNTKNSYKNDDDNDDYENGEELKKFKKFVVDTKILITQGHIDSAVDKIKKFAQTNDYRYMAVLIDDFEKEFNEWNLRRFSGESQVRNIQTQYENFARKLATLLDSFDVALRKKK